MAGEQASFIPKSGVRTVQRTHGVRRIYLLAYISYIVFFSTLFVVVGVYLYAAAVNRSVSSLRDQLTTERARFSVADIEDIRQMDQRLKTAKKLLDESTAPSRLFGDIEKIVASNISFTSLSYTQLPNRQFKVALIGRAEDFNQIINQRSLIGQSELLKNASVVDYDYGVAEGEEAGASISAEAALSFTFSDTRDLSMIAYRASETESTVVLNETVATSTTESAATESVVVGEARPAENEPVPDTTGGPTN